MSLFQKIQGYFTNNFVFFNPEFDIQKTDINTKRVIFVKKGTNEGEKYIPCLFIQEYEQRNKFLIFFHGNSEDIFISELLGQYLSEFLKMNVIIVEYPGYSIYEEKKSADIICEDSRIIYKFIKETFDLKPEDIFVLGRSLGTGPATFLASIEKINSLYLISPFKSIKSIYGIFSKLLLLDIFKSIEIIEKVTCPLKIIHGGKDTLINPGHSIELMDVINSIHPNFIHEIKISQNMTHNEMDIEKDIFNEINDFIAIHKLYGNFKKNYFSLKDKRFDNLFDIPISVQKFLFKKNLELDSPVAIKKEKAKCSLLLNDRRIAFGMDNCQILVYDTEEDENQITIETKEIGQIKFLLQLRDNILVACGDYTVGFYSLKRFKFTKINDLKIENRIIKIEKDDDNNIYILTKNIITLFKFSNKDSKILIEKEWQFNYQNLKTDGQFVDFILIDSYVVISTASTIYTFYYERSLKRLDKIKDNSIKNINIIRSNNGMIKFNNYTILLLSNLQCHFINMKDFSFQNLAHNIASPSYVYKVNENSFIIGNNNKYRIISVDLEKKNFNEISKKSISNTTEKITSFFVLTNGRIVYTTSNTRNTLDEKDIDNLNQSNDEGCAQIF